MRHEDLDIAIVGGGICGLVTALALEQRGLTPTVYEAASEYRPVGAGILLQTNALLIFDHLGVADQLKDVGVPLDETLIRSPSGRVLQRFDLDEVERTEFGYGSVAIHRADLQTILLNELDSEIVTGKRCQAVTGIDNPTVIFTDDTTLNPDLVIGTDGINSTVREVVVTDVKPQTRDLVAFRAVARNDLPEVYPAQGVEVWGTGTYTGGAPLNEDSFYWFATAPQSQFSLSHAAPSSKTLLELRAHFASYPDPIPTVLESLTEDEVFTTCLAELPALNRWSHGAICLAGDAAHAMLPFAGQGAAQAIEDGLLLAHSLYISDNYEDAFDLYERARKQRADQIRTESHRLGQLASIQSGFGSCIRNLVARLSPSLLFRHARLQRVAHTSLPTTGIPSSVQMP